MNRFFLLFFVVALVASCQPKASNADQPAEANPEAQQQATTTQPPNPASTGGQSYPSIPLDTLTMLWEKCDYVDFVFYNFNFSMSQDEKVGIQSTLRHIAEETPVINPSCPPMGRIFFQVDGRNALEADFFIGDECLYYIFYDNGKKAYANKMTDMGKNFFASIFSQMMKSSE